MPIIPNPKPVFPTDFKLPSVDHLKEKAQEALTSPRPPEVEEAIAKSKSFYEKNSSVIVVSCAALVLLKLNKRMVRKATAQAVVAALKSTSVRMDVAKYAADWDAWTLARDGQKYVTGTWN